jgi:hypothetical protein
MYHGSTILLCVTIFVIHCVLDHESIVIGTSQHYCARAHNDRALNALLRLSHFSAFLLTKSLVPMNI